jgi:MFS family permease
MEEEDGVELLQRRVEFDDVDLDAPSDPSDPTALPSPGSAANPPSPADAMHSPMRFGSTRFVALMFFSVLSKLFINVSTRVLYPFDAYIASSLALPKAAVLVAISAGQIASTASLALSMLGDRIGHFALVFLGCFLASASTATIALLPKYTPLLLGYVALNFGATLMAPNLQILVASTAPPHRVGLVTGALEVSWGFAALLGFPLYGFVAARWGWPSPFFLFFILISLSSICWCLVVRRPRKSLAAKSNLLLKQRVAKIFRSRLLLLTFVSVICTFTALDALAVNVGEFLQASFDLAVEVKATPPPHTTTTCAHHAPPPLPLNKRCTFGPPPF